MTKFEYKFEIEAETEAQANALFKELVAFAETRGAEIVAFSLERTRR